MLPIRHGGFALIDGRALGGGRHRFSGREFERRDPKDSLSIFGQVASGGDRRARRLSIPKQRGAESGSRD
jgi:hypothetical protein